MTALGDVGPNAVTGGPVMGVSILGSASYRPEKGIRLVGNDEVDEVVRGHGHKPMTAEWIEAAGVSERWWSATPGEVAAADAATTHEMLAGAAAAAIEDAGVDRSDVDLLIAATTTTSRLTTSMAATAGGLLGIRCGAFEVRAGCASASYALALAYSQFAIGAQCVVVTSAETLSKVAPGGGPIPYIAADGAGAVVLTRSDENHRGLLASWLSGDGAASALAGAPGSLPPTLDELEADHYRLVADRRFDEAAASWWTRGPAIVGERISGPISAFIANQANQSRIYESAGSAGIADEAVVNLVAETANAGAASQMMALDRARRDGRAGNGSTIMVSAVGGGLSAATLAIRP